MTERKNPEIVHRLLERASGTPTGGRLSEAQEERFIELCEGGAESMWWEPAQKDPSFTPDPRACPLCKERGKTWQGSDPTCAFLNDEKEFDPANWNCATMNELRALEDQPQARRWRSDDQSLLVFPHEGEYLILSWYKERGRADGGWTLYSDLIEPLDLEAAERFLRAGKMDKDKEADDGA